MKYFRLWLIISWLISFYGCQPVTIGSNKTDPDTSSNQMVRVNKFLIAKDIDAIKAYAKRRNWQLQQTESGLFYHIYKTNASGKPAVVGSTAVIKYNCQLLDGTFCYSSDSLGLRNIIIGAGKAESGLDEGLVLLKTGEAAHLFLLPHLAFGLMGDENKIPPRSTIVYDVELIKFEEN